MKRHTVGKAKRHVPAGWILAEDLQPGDILTRDHDGKSYDVIIVNPRRPTKDQFGRDMISYRSRILPGRDAGSRAGDEGDIMFGPGGVVRQPRKAYPKPEVTSLERKRLRAWRRATGQVL